MLRGNNTKTSPDLWTVPGAETDVCCCSSRMGGRSFSVWSKTSLWEADPTHLSPNVLAALFSKLIIIYKIGTHAGSPGPCHRPSKRIPLQLCYNVDLELAAVWILLLYVAHMPKISTPHYSQLASCPLYNDYTAAPAAGILDLKKKNDATILFTVTGIFISHVFLKYWRVSSKCALNQMQIVLLVRW